MACARLRVSWRRFVRRRIEGIDGPRNLEAEYAAACDDNYDPDRLPALFVEDVTWESEGMGRYEGREPSASACIRRSRWTEIPTEPGGTSSCPARWAIRGKPCDGPISTRRNTSELTAGGWMRARNRLPSSTRLLRRAGPGSDSYDIRPSRRRCNPSPQTLVPSAAGRLDFGDTQPLTPAGGERIQWSHHCGRGG